MAAKRLQNSKLCLLLLISTFLLIALPLLASDAAVTKEQKALSGRTVYKRVCMACHTLNVWGAPKLGDRKAWSGRISKGKSALYSSAITGFNKMPPRGYCQFCTDAEIKSAVDYILSKSQPRL